MDTETATKYAGMLKALSDPFRLKILALLPDHADCELVLNVNDLIAKLGGSQPNMSHHLKVLKDAGIVVKKKMCSSVYFHKDKQTLLAVQKFVEAL
jgi:ArsR family transcriptional regulator